MNRHEYEINQLINPKKDIVKSNSKHRDKIETLIQGRRGGGINRGGETPFVPTPWRFRLNAHLPGPYNYVCGTTRKDSNGIVALEAQGPNLSSAYVYDENGNEIEIYTPSEGMFVYQILPNFNQKTGAQIEKYDFMVVSSETINLDDYLLINA